VKLTITIDLENAAFEDGNGYEVAGILRDLAGDLDDTQLREDGLRMRLRDSNGNSVGLAEVTD
jgi:hypothetical protein